MLKYIIALFTCGLVIIVIYLSVTVWATNKEHDKECLNSYSDYQSAIPDKIDYLNRPYKFNCTKWSN